MMVGLTGRIGLDILGLGWVEWEDGVGYIGMTIGLGILGLGWVYWDWVGYTGRIGLDILGLGWVGSTGIGLGILG